MNKKQTSQTSQTSQTVDKVMLTWALNKFLPFSVKIIEVTPLKVHIVIENQLYKLYTKGDNTLLQAKHLSSSLRRLYPELFL